jgi:hypothetical protein
MQEGTKKGFNFAAAREAAVKEILSSPEFKNDYDSAIMKALLENKKEADFVLRSRVFELEDTQAFKEFCQAEDDKGIHRVNVVQEIQDNTRIRMKLG